VTENTTNRMLPNCLRGSCTELKGHWRLFVLVPSFYIFFLATSGAK